MAAKKAATAAVNAAAAGGWRHSDSRCCRQAGAEGCLPTEAATTSSSLLVAGTHRFFQPRLPRPGREPQRHHRPLLFLCQPPRCQRCQRLLPGSLLQGALLPDRFRCALRLRGPRLRPPLPGRRRAAASAAGGLAQLALCPAPLVKLVQHASQLPHILLVVLTRLSTAAPTAAAAAAAAGSARAGVAAACRRCRCRPHRRCLQCGGAAARGLPAIQSCVGV